MEATYGLWIWGAAVARVMLEIGCLVEACDPSHELMIRIKFLADWHMQAACRSVSFARLH
jgi:hypothetical protein